MRSRTHKFQLCVVHVGLYKTDEIVHDSNSYFRSVAKVISGSQKGHCMIRSTVVKYMEDHNAKYMTCVGKAYDSISDYIKHTNMMYVGNSATEIEIQATADALGVNIFVYSAETWVKYSTSSTMSMLEGIYLNHSKNDHFEPLLCVKRDEQVCCDLCKLPNSSNTQYMYRRGSNIQSHSPAKPEACFSKYMKCKRKLLSKNLYHINITRKETLKANSIKKYQDNILHRQKVKARSIYKYKTDVLHNIRAKAMSIGKYHHNILHRDRLKAMSINKYKDDNLHRTKVKKNEY